ACLVLKGLDQQAELAFHQSIDRSTPLVEERQRVGTLTERVVVSDRPIELGKLCTGGRAGADGWLSHDGELVHAGVDLVVAACDAHDAGPCRPAGLTGRTSPVVAAVGGGPGRGWPVRTR